MAAKFVLEKDATGQFRFRLRSQGRVLATSDGYTTRRAAQNAITSLRRTAPAATVEDATGPQPSKARAPKATAKAGKRQLPSGAAAVVAPTSPPAKKSRRKAAVTGGETSGDK